MMPLQTLIIQLKQLIANRASIEDIISKCKEIGGLCDSLITDFGKRSKVSKRINNIRKAAEHLLEDKLSHRAFYNSRHAITKTELIDTEYMENNVDEIGEILKIEFREINDLYNRILELKEQVLEPMKVQIIIQTCVDIERRGLRLLNKYHKDRLVVRKLKPIISAAEMIKANCRVKDKILKERGNKKLFLRQVEIMENFIKEIAGILGIELAEIKGSYSEAA